MTQTIARREVDIITRAAAVIAAHGPEGAVRELLRQLDAERAGDYALEYAVRFPADRFGPERIAATGPAGDRARLHDLARRYAGRGAELLVRTVRRGPWEPAA